MIPSPYYVTEQEHQHAFEKYWLLRGIKVETTIDSQVIGKHPIMSLRSNLVMKVPRMIHKRVFGKDQNEIKAQHRRKWQ